MERTQTTKPLIAPFLSFHNSSTFPVLPRRQSLDPVWGIDKFPKFFGMELQPRARRSKSIFILLDLDADRKELLLPRTGFIAVTLPQNRSLRSSKKTQKCVKFCLVRVLRGYGIEVHSLTTEMMTKCSANSTVPSSHSISYARPVSLDVHVAVIAALH